MTGSAAAPLRWHLVAAASSRIGYGHVARCQMLAGSLAARGIPYRLTTLEAPPEEGTAITLVSPTQHDVIVLDAPDDALEAFRGLEGTAALVVAFRMFGLYDVARPFEDVALTPSFDPPSEQAMAGDPGRVVLSGRSLILVRPSCFAGPDAPEHRPPRVLVSMGGADPFGLTALACHGLEPLAPHCPVTVVVGALNEAAPELRNRFGGRFDVVDQRDVDFDALLLRATVAVIAGGLTRYECIAARTPFVAMSFDVRQAAITERVVREGFGRHLGLAREVSPTAVLDATRELLDDETTRTAMRRRAVGVLDPNAATSMVERIERAWRDVGRNAT